MKNSNVVVSQCGAVFFASLDPAASVSRSQKSRTVISCSTSCTHSRSHGLCLRMSLCVLEVSPRKICTFAHFMWSYFSSGQNDSCVSPQHICSPVANSMLGPTVANLIHSPVQIQPAASYDNTRHVPAREPRLLQKLLDHSSGLAFHIHSLLENSMGERSTMCLSSKGDRPSNCMTR